MVNRPHIGTPRIRWISYSVQTCTILGSIPGFAIPYNARVCWQDCAPSCRYSCASSRRRWHSSCCMRMEGARAFHVYVGHFAGRESLMKRTLVTIVTANREPMRMFYQHGRQIEPQLYRGNNVAFTLEAGTLALWHQSEGADKVIPVEACRASNAKRHRCLQRFCHNADSLGPVCICSLSGINSSVF